MFTFSETLVIGLICGSFAWGVAWATNSRKVSTALRLARLANRRINELEDATGRHTTLREEDL